MNMCLGSTDRRPPCLDGSSGGSRTILEPLERRILLSAPPQLLKDINLNTGDSSPSGFVEINGTTFFAADDGVHGSELWKSDGTAAGTVMVTQINPGSAIANPAYLTNVNGTLFFRAEDGAHGHELWKSDGTAAGTVMAADMAPGSASSSPSALTSVNRTLFFRADDGSTGGEPWILDTNETPIAADDAFRVDEDGSHSGTLVATDADAGDTLSYRIETPPSHGSLAAFNVDTGAFTYEPTPGYVGQDGFTFIANDTWADSNEATVAIDVGPPIRGWVWSDTDANGLQDVGEPGFAGAVAVLFDPGGDGQVGGTDDVSLGTCITAADGNYAFDGLSPGSYYLQFRTPPDHAFAPQDAGGDDQIDSDADATGLTDVFTLTAGQNHTSHAAGLTGSSPDFGWAFAVGSSGNVHGQSIAIDLAGNRYVTGYFEGGGDFDPGEGEAYSIGAGEWDVFVAKYSPAGGLVWVRTLGGTGDDLGQDIAVDTSGNVWTAGSFSGSIDFDPGAGTHDLASAGGADIFVLKLDAAGQFVWAGAMGGPTDDVARGIAVDAWGNVHTTGYFEDTADFDPGAATYDLTSAGGRDVFISKLDATGHFVWARAVGGVGRDHGHGIALDPWGNVHTTGDFEDTADFDPGAGTHDLTSAGEDDVFVSKLDVAGNFVWAGVLGGNGTDNSRAVDVDASGNVYITGWFEDTADFDPGSGTENLTSAGSADAFVAKLDAAGNFTWACAMGGTDIDLGLGVAVDAWGNVHTTGSFSKTADLDPGPATEILSSAGSPDVFVSKLDAAGNFTWAAGMGGAGGDYGYGIAVDVAGNVWTTGSFGGSADFAPGPDQAIVEGQSASAFVSTLNTSGAYVGAVAVVGSGQDQGRATATDTAGNVYVTGPFEGEEDFDPGPGVYRLTSRSYSDLFLAKYTPTGALVWAGAMSADSGPYGDSIAVDAAGNVYTTGYFSGTVDFDPGPGTQNLTSVGSGDVFVSKLDAAGDFVWARVFGGTDYDRASDIAVDASGNVYTTGSFDGTVDFDPGAGTYNLTSAGPNDFFVSKLDASGNFVWARAMGGASSYTRGEGIALDTSGNVYTAGYFRSTVDFGPGSGTLDLTSAGGTDVFVSKFDAAGDVVWARAMGGTSGDVGSGIALDASGNVYVTGGFEDTADFDPGADTQILSSAGGRDVFVAKLDAAGSFVWARAMGGTDFDHAHGIAADAAGNVYITGWFRGTPDFDPGAGTQILTGAGHEDVFVAKLDAAGAFAWAYAVGSADYDQGQDIAVDAWGNVHATGILAGTADLDPRTDVFDVVPRGSGLFISKVRQDPTDITLSHSSVAENQPAGTVVGTFSTTDLDAPGLHTYALVSGAGDADNASFTIDGDELKTAESFDYDTKSTYTIRVRTTNSSDLWIEEAFTITVVVPLIAVTDSSGDTDDAGVQFITALSQYRAGASDVALVRPTCPDEGQYIDVTNVGGLPLTLSEIQINAPDVTAVPSLTADDITLIPGETQRFELTYAPTRPSVADPTAQKFDLADGLMIISNADNAPVFDVALRGASTFRSDVTYDGIVNLAELGPLNANFGKTWEDSTWDPTVDIDGDGAINLAELGPLNAEFGRQLLAVGQAPAAAAPAAGGDPPSFEPAATSSAAPIPAAAVSEDVAARAGLAAMRETPSPSSPATRSSQIDEYVDGRVLATAPAQTAAADITPATVYPVTLGPDTVDTPSALDSAAVSDLPGPPAALLSGFPFVSLTDGSGAAGRRHSS